MSENTNANENPGTPTLFMTVSPAQIVQAPVDKTLSIQEMAADAKATGDAINNLGDALEQEIEELAADVVLKSMIDASLTTSGNAADAKATGDAIEALAQATEQAIGAVAPALVVNEKHFVEMEMTLYGSDIAVTNAEGAHTVSEAIAALQEKNASAIIYEDNVTIKQAMDSEISTAEIDEIFENVFGGGE